MSRCLMVVTCPGRTLKTNHEVGFVHNMLKKCRFNFTSASENSRWLIWTLLILFPWISCEIPRWSSDSLLWFPLPAQFVDSSVILLSLPSLKKHSSWLTSFIPPLLCGILICNHDSPSDHLSVSLPLEFKLHRGSFVHCCTPRQCLVQSYSGNVCAVSLWLFLQYNMIASEQIIVT